MNEFEEGIGPQGEERERREMASSGLFIPINAHNNGMSG
jgi:hypothetical protein